MNAGNCFRVSFFAKLDLPCPQGTVDLENTLCQIDPDYYGDPIGWVVRAAG